MTVSLRKSPVLAIFAATVALSACGQMDEPTAPSRDPTPGVDAKQAAPYTAARPVEADDWTSWPRAEGDWVYRQDGRGSIALFGPVGQDAIFSIRCDSDANLIVLSRKGAAPMGADMVLRASQGMASVDAQRVEGQLAYMAAGLAPASQILDQMAFSRGHFAVEMAGIAPVKIPVWPEFSHVIEDCRS